MASFAQKLTSLAKQSFSKVEPHLKSASTTIAKQYDKTLAENAQYVVKDPEAASKLWKQLVFTNLARVPAGYAQCQQETKAVKELWQKKGEMSLKEIGVYVAFVGEIYAWFCIGEIIGRGGTITGYDVGTAH